jgi:hypothetical protein
MELRQVSRVITHEALASYKGSLEILIRDEIDYCVSLLVRPDQRHARQRIEYLEERISMEPAPWVESWYARLLRWLMKFRRVRYHLPRVLRFIGDGKLPRHVFERKRLPDDTAQRIICQIEAMHRQGESPSMVIVGERAYMSIRVMPLQYTCSWQDPYHPTIFGLKVKVSSWLAPNTVVVI